MLPKVRRYGEWQVDRERWETILGACSDAVAVLDGDGTIVLASPPLERMLGGRDLVDQSFTDLMHPGHVADFTGTLVTFVADVGVSTSSEWRLRRSDGAWVLRSGSGRWQVLVGKPADRRSMLENYGLWLDESDRAVAFFGGRQ